MTEEVSRFEREISFSDNEKVQIAFYAREAANFGEDFVWDLVLAKNKVMKLSLIWQDSPSLKALFPEREDILHEVDVLEEVVRQARVIMQFEGKDDLSVLDREAQAAGLGSIFDPNSEIGKNMRFF